MSDPAAPTPTPQNPTTPPPVAPPADPPAPSPEPSPEPPKQSLLSESTFDPEKLTLPDGFEKNEIFEEFTTIAKEMNLPTESGQKLLGLYQKAAEAMSSKVTQAWEAQNAKWQEEVKNDPEVGGTKFDGVKQSVSRLLDNPELSDPGFRDALNFTGAGNHPAVVRTLARWAKALSEGSSVQGGAPGRDAKGGLVNGPKDLAEAIYGPSGPYTGGPKLS